ncbi:MAG: MarR family transcriptional regulator [Myxococcota bacterium]
MATDKTSDKKKTKTTDKTAGKSESETNNWTFFTNYGHVLFFLASNPDARARDIADVVQITERAAQRIVHELEAEGYLKIEKKGRRNSYLVNAKKKLRHPLEKHVAIQELIEALDL